MTDGPISHVTRARRRLPNRRTNVSFDIELHGLRYTCTYSTFADGSPSELFIQNHKPGSQSDSNARDAAVAASLALQFGCPVEVLRRALLRDAKGCASTPLGSALDAIDRERGGAA